MNYSAFLRATRKMDAHVEYVTEGRASSPHSLTKEINAALYDHNIEEVLGKGAQP